MAERLADELRDLAPGERLATHRELVRRFGASATTVSTALAILGRRGLVETRPGAGTFRAAPRTVPRVGDTSWQEATLDLNEGIGPGPSRTFHSPGLMGALSTPGPDVVDLNGGYLHPELQPRAALAAALARAARRPEAWRRPPATGLAELRDWFAEDIGQVAGQDVLICGGGQAALATTLRALTQPGAAVLVESPTYPGTIAAAVTASLVPVPVPADEHGLQPDYVEQALARTRARVIVVQPLFQNPTGICMSAQRQRELRRIAREHEAFILEDDYARHMAHTDAGPLPAPMAADDPDGTVVHIRSLTKVTSPNVRVGALVARGPAMARLRAAVAVDSMFVPAPLQYTALEVLTATGWQRGLRRLQAELTRRREVAVRAVSEVFGADALALHPRGGYHLWVRLPQPLDAQRFAAAAMACGVAVTPGGNYHPREHTASHVRISYVAMPSAADVQAGIHRLAGPLADRD